MRATVYRFWVSNVENTKSVLAPLAATECAIAKIERARPIMATAEEVEEYLLDEGGFLLP